MSIIAFPVKPSADIAGEARQFADAVDAGEHGDVQAAILLTSGKSLETHYWGSDLNLVEAIGILETAKHFLVRRLMS